MSKTIWMRIASVACVLSLMLSGCALPSFLTNKNNVTTVYFEDGEKYSFAGENSAYLTALLRNASYATEELGECDTPYIVDTKHGTGYRINTYDGFVCKDNQRAWFTAEETARVLTILDWARARLPKKSIIATTTTLSSSDESGASTTLSTAAGDNDSTTSSKSSRSWRSSSTSGYSRTTRSSQTSKSSRTWHSKSPTTTTKLSSGTNTSKGNPNTSKSTTATTKSNSHRISGVPVMDQMAHFPAGREATAAVMALRYAGTNISVANFVDNHLPMSNDFTTVDGQRHGPSPYEYYVGDPRSASGYGCMAPVIEKALVSVLGSDERVHTATGMSMAELCERYIKNDIPVLVWATIEMTNPGFKESWILPDGSVCNWPSNENCLVLVGYDERRYYFNDPYSGRGRSCLRKLGEQRYADLGSQAIAILPE